jgi:hypothetical protein
MRGLDVAPSPLSHLKVILFVNKNEMYSKQIKQKQIPWPESANELYRSSDRQLSAKLVLTFADKGVSRGQRGVSPTAVMSDF